MGAGSSNCQFKDHYFLQRVKLGEGSFGTVWRGINRKTSEVVAVKQLEKSKFALRGVQRADVDREISILQAIEHENVTRLFQFFEDDQFIYLALEYCEGGDFGDKVRERSSEVEESEAAIWIRQMCAAIFHMHMRLICHRDLKPENFMLAREGTLKLTDFGLATYVKSGELLTLKCGTPAFMSPEQHRLPFSDGYTLPVDLWAAGVSMSMVLLGGKHPFLTEKGNIDEKRLLTGYVEFQPVQSFLGRIVSGTVPARDSEGARDLCKAMVEPDASKRLTACLALRKPWLVLPHSAVQIPDKKVSSEPAPLCMTSGRSSRSRGAGLREAARGLSASARARLSYKKSRAA